MAIEKSVSIVFNHEVLNGKTRQTLRLSALAALAVLLCWSCSSNKTATTNSRSFKDGLILSVVPLHREALPGTSVLIKITVANRSEEEKDFCIDRPSSHIMMNSEQIRTSAVMVTDHPYCKERRLLRPGQEITWNEEKIVFPMLAGDAQLIVRLTIIDPQSCNRKTGCDSASVIGHADILIVAETLEPE